MIRPARAIPLARSRQGTLTGNLLVRKDAAERWHVGIVAGRREWTAGR